MNLALGIDTSNYTTSLALYDAQAHEICQVKRLLPVKEGEKGLRQSDAVFHHVQQLPELMDKLWKPGCGKALSAVVSPPVLEMLRALICPVLPWG